MAYDFTTLSPQDFEELVSDLFSEEWGGQLEIFKAGRDRGIDLRNSRVAAASHTIIQCKRYAPTKFRELRRAMLEERRKLAKLSFKRYVLATSVPLSPDNKQALVHDLKPYLRGPENIYGAAELNGMLRRFPNVVRAHFKLWISTTSVLERVLNADIFNVTDATIDSIKEQMSRLVVHDAYARASATLEDNGHCIIAGNPGIGKSTLARMLMCEYLQQGYTPIAVVGDIADAWSTITRGSRGQEKYVVFYDDFLGTFRFDEAKFSKNEDASLLRFIDSAKKGAHLRFILTTREYIMADARRLHETFAREADHLARCTILLQDYAPATRAQVLFNHLYFSDLPESRLRAICSSAIYRELVSHRHFNPRVIESIARHTNSASLTDDQYIEFLCRRFDDPSELWRHPFQNQVSPTARQILVLLWSFGGTAELETLKEALLAFSNLEAAVALPFESAMKELVGNFLVSNRYERARTSQEFVYVAQFQNPSVQEFIERNVAIERSWHQAVAEQALFFVQIASLMKWAESTLVHRDSGPASAAFWQALHNRAASAETRRAGRLIRLRGRARTEYSENDGFRSIDRTYVLLKIMRHLESNDARSDQIKERIETTTGWLELLSDASIIGSVAQATESVVQLLVEQPISRIDLASVRAAFAEALGRILQENDTWAAGLRSLAQLAKCSRLLQLNDSAGHARLIRAIATRSVSELVDHEDSIAILDESVRALYDLDSLVRLGARELDTVLMEKASKIASASAHAAIAAGPREVEYRVAPRATTNLNLDELFAGLLER